MSKSHCDECVKNDEDCCSSYYTRFVTLGDVRRIARFLEKQKEGVFRQGKKETPSARKSGFLRYAELSDYDKRTELYAKRPHNYYYDLARDGKVLQIREKKNRACMFFRKDGSCRIYPSRPLACRVFPFWFSDRGKIIVDNNGFDCPIACGKKPLNENPSEAGIRSGLRKIGYKKSEIKELISQLMKEIEEYRKNIGSFVKKNRI